MKPRRIRVAFRLLSVLVPVLVLGACASQPPSASVTDAAKPAPVLFGNLGRHHRAVTTKSAEAQRWFDQGLVLVFAFNHDEAIRSFGEAARLDPACAMAWWGIALANGPHINNPAMDPEHSAAAFGALEKAVANAKGASPVERALIDALAKRYAEKPPEDRKPLDAAYAEAMRGVLRAYPADADVGALTAEALMDLHPWDFWTIDGSTKSYKWSKDHEEPIQEIGFVPYFEDVTVEQVPGETQEVEMHDGSKLRLKALRADYDPRDRRKAMDLLSDAREKQEFLTGLIYINEQTPDFLTQLNMIDEPLATLPESKTRPGREALDAIMKELA